MVLRSAVASARKSREERRIELLACARQVFADKGYHGATVDDIAAKAGVARGTFYLYFDDRRAVFEALVDEFFVRLTAQIRSIELDSSEPPLTQLRNNLHRLVSLALAEPEMMKLLLHDAAGLDPELDDKLATFYQAMSTFLEESLDEGQRIGLVRAGDKPVMVALGIGGLKEILLRAVTGKLPADADVLVEEIMRFFEAGLLARN
jgi:AcrR family transcriptional regulator